MLWAIQMKRIYWIDNLKAFAIFLVVFGHYEIMPAAKTYVYSFHMPLFFFLSGLFFDARKYRTYHIFIKKRILKIIVSYLIFACLQLIFNLIKNMIDHNQINLGSFISQEVINILIFKNYWFIWALLVTEMIYWQIKKHISQNSVLLLLVAISSVVGYLLNTVLSFILNFPLLWAFKLTFSTIVFYAIGNIFKDNILAIDWREFLNRYTTLIILVLSANFIAYGFFFSSHQSISVTNPQNYFFFYLLAFSGIFNSIVFIQLLCKNNLLSFIGRNTLIIYVLHSNPGVVKRLLAIIGYQLDLTNMTIALAALCSILMILLIAPIAYFFEKYLPLFINMRPLCLRISNNR